MAGTKVVLHSSGVKAMLTSSGVASDMQARAERVADAARSAAPVASGAYRDSIEAYTVTTDRAVGRAGAGVEYAFIVEAAHGVLARALDAAS